VGVAPICAKCYVSDIYSGWPVSRTDESNLGVFYNLNMLS